jgi:hypothetical protein
MFAQKLAEGKVGESVIATWLRQRHGYHILPVYEVSSGQFKGPALYTQDGRGLIAPDLLAVKANSVRWIEAKNKGAFTWHRLTRQWVTGINLEHYRDYLEIARISPWPVYLLFLQGPGTAKDSPDGCPTGLFGGEILSLSTREHHRSARWGSSGMVYWAHGALRRLASLDEVW